MVHVCYMIKLFWGCCGLVGGVYSCVSGGCGSSGGGGGGGRCFT
jgi:hypothetical protein